MRNEVLRIAAPYPHLEAKDSQGLPQRATDFGMILGATKSLPAIRNLARYFTQIDTDRTIDDVEDIEELEEIIDQLELFHTLSEISEHGYLLAPMTPTLQNYFSQVLEEAVRNVFLIKEDKDGKEIIVGHNPEIDVFPIGIDENRLWKMATFFHPGLESEPTIWDSLVLIAESGIFDKPLDRIEDDE